MTVIVLAHTLGWRGDEITAAIAAGLHIELVTHGDLLRRVAEHMDINESAVGRVAEGRPSWFERQTIDRTRLLRCMAGEVVRLAARGNVLLEDQGAVSLLRPISHVISIRVWAPAEPTHDLETAAAARSDSPAYDLVINAGRVSAEQCVEQVVRLAAAPGFRPTEASRAMLADLIGSIERASTLVGDPAAERAPPVLEVEVGNQTIKLTGVACSEEAIAGIEEHLHGRKVLAYAPAHALPRCGTCG